MKDNVHHLPSSPAMQALILARAIQPGYLDRILRDELRNLPPTPTPDEALERLAQAGDVVHLADHAWPGGILHSFLDQVERLKRERDQARGIATTLEQQLGEIDRIAEQWTRLREPTKAAMGRLVHDVTRGDRDDQDGAA